MKLDKLEGTLQFYIPESLVKRFLTLRTKAGINDLDLNIIISLDGDFNHTVRILNGNFKENKFVEIKRNAEK